MDFIERNHFNDLRRYNEKSLLELNSLVKYAIKNEDIEMLELTTNAMRDLRNQVYDKLTQRKRAK
jgi:hypothetical protein